MLEKVEKYIKPYLVPLSIAAIALGVGLRFYNIMQNDFVFYDEGYYINDDWRDFVQAVKHIHPHGLGMMLKVIYGNLRISLASGKALWIFLINSRVFFNMADDLYVSRVISAVFGSLTIWVTYIFARRYFDSRKIGVLSAVILAVMPSHLFYSRLGMQEALSTFCFLLGFYFYVFPRQLHWRTFLSAVFFMLAYFTNYRLVVIPILVGFCEFYTFLKYKQFPDVRKYIWNTLAFFVLIFSVGSIDKGQHLTVILPWMWHQAHLAEKEPFHWVNLLSYPYFTFRLESFFFGLFFWGNIYNIIKKRWYILYPFFQVCFQMLLFSFPEEKGARYVAVTYPFMVMAVGALIVQLYEDRKETWARATVAVCVVLLTVTMTTKSWALAHSRSNYRDAMAYLMQIDKKTKLVTSQMFVMNLYTDYPNDVQDLPHTFQQMVTVYSLGYRYLVIDPQAYISWGKNEQRFNPELDNYLSYVISEVRPVKIFPNFSDVLLERFVLEHNQNLLQSIKFLKLAKENEFGQIRIYEMTKPIETLLRVIALKSGRVAISQDKAPQANMSIQPSQPRRIPQKP